jgi:tetratricopeptide (TPR) repeat protein
MKEYDQSLQAYDRGLSILDTNATFRAHKNDMFLPYGSFYAGRAFTLRAMDRCSDAVPSADLALESTHCYRNIFTQKPFDPVCNQLWTLKAECLEQMQKPAEAAVVRGILSDPGDAPGHADKGELLAGNGKCSEAMGELDASIARYPYYYYAWLEKGKCQLLAAMETKSPSDLNASLESFSRAIAIRPLTGEGYL